MQQTKPSRGGANRARKTNRYPVGRERKFLSKKGSMARRTGRPPGTAQQILADMSAREKHVAEIVDQKINLYTPGILAFEAASLLGAIEHGTHHLAIESTPIFQKINQYARKNGPHGKWRATRDFLEEFIETNAPGWNWREDARQGEIESRVRKQEDRRIAKDIAEDARWRMSWATKYYTPDVPDGFLLCGLAREDRNRRRFIRRTWPTLRELKLATAIPERTLKKIIVSLRPKNGEIVKEPLRHRFNRRGAVPLHYGPRLIVGVLHELLNRLQEFSIQDEERERLRKAILSVKRAFAARLGYSRRST